MACQLDVSGGKVKRPILEAAIDLRGAWGGMDLEQRRHVLGSFLGVVWVWGHHDFRFIARGFEPAGLSGPGRKGPKPVPLENTDLEGEIRMFGAGDVTEGTGDVA